MGIWRWTVRYVSDDALEQAVNKETPGTAAYDIARTELLRRKSRPHVTIGATTLVLIATIVAIIAVAVILKVIGR